MLRPTPICAMFYTARFTACWGRLPTSTTQVSLFQCARLHICPLASVGTCTANFRQFSKKRFVWLLLQTSFSGIYLGANQDILFADSRAILDTELSNLRKQQKHSSLLPEVKCAATPKSATSAALRGSLSAFPVMENAAIQLRQSSGAQGSGWNPASWNSKGRPGPPFWVRLRISALMPCVNTCRIVSVSDEVVIITNEKLQFTIGDKTKVVSQLRAVDKLGQLTVSGLATRLFRLAVVY